MNEQVKYGFFADLSSALIAQSEAEDHRGAGGLCRDAAKEIRSLQKELTSLRASQAALVEALEGIALECQEATPDWARIQARDGWQELGRRQGEWRLSQMARKSLAALAQSQERT